MFIAKDKNLIILARNTLEELEQALNLMSYDSIEETDVEYTLVDGVYITADEAKTKEREYVAMLSLTAADVERAIYKAKGMDFDDIISVVTELQPEGLDIKALKIELKANHFYRGNPYIDIVGTILGFSQEQLDYLFKNGCFEEQEVNNNA